MTSSIKIACSGYPVGQRNYQSHLNAVELSSMFEGLPRASTVERWKKEAKAGFEFIACAPETITHPVKDGRSPAAHRFGYFQDTTEVNAAARTAIALAESLGARTMLFRLPRTMGPNADQVDRLHKFFRRVDRRNLSFAWEPPAAWPASLVASVSKALSLCAALNPLSRPPDAGVLRYFRLGAGGKTSGLHRFSDEELARIKAACGRGYSYVVFNNGPFAFEDAVRFAATI